MSINASWIQQATRTDQLAPTTIVIKAEDQTQISNAIVIKPEEPQIFLQTSDGQQSRLIKLHTAPSAMLASKCSMFTQTEPTNRFTQTDTQVATVTYRTDNNRQDGPSAIVTYEPGQVYIATTLDGKKDNEGKPAEFPFCYNLQTTAGTPVGTAVLDEKGCYRLDMGSSLTYNYVVNPVISTAYKCEVCGATFTQMNMYNQHKATHDSGEMIQEVNISTQEEPAKPYACEFCEMSFNLSGELISHRNAMHKDQQVTISHTVDKEKNTITKYCESCGAEMVFLNTPGLKKKKFKCGVCVPNPPPNASIIYTNTAVSEDGVRMQTVQPISVPNTANSNNNQPTGIKPGHHPVKKRGVQAVTKCLTCNGSGIIFIGASKKNSNNANSNTTTEKQFVCNICGGSFSRYSSLWSHKRLHSGDKPFKCQTCGLCFAKAAYLKNHLRVHTGEKPFKCSICSMQFSQSPHLKNHERIHSGEKPYQCEVCLKSFARHSTLWNHRRIHTGEKPYKCDICDSKFNQATHLKNHAKVHTGERPFKCDVCEVCFADRFALKRHKAVHEKYARAAKVEVEPSLDQEDPLNF